MTRAAIYVRVSTTRQAENDPSLPDQIGQCRTYCERHGWEVVEVFSEPGASALDDDRPSFQEMIFKAKRADHPFDRVVVHSLSRFSRDPLTPNSRCANSPKPGCSWSGSRKTWGMTEVAISFARCPTSSTRISRARTPSIPIGRCARTPARASGTAATRHSATRSKSRRSAGIRRRRCASLTRPRPRPSAKSRPCLGPRRPAGRRQGHCVPSQRTGRLSAQAPVPDGRVHELLSSTTYYGVRYFNRPAGQPEREASSAVAVGDAPGPGDNRRAHLQCRSRLAAKPQPEADAAPRRQRPDLFGGRCTLRLLRRGVDPEHRQGRRVSVLLLLPQVEGGVTACRGFRMPMDRLDDIVVGGGREARPGAHPPRGNVTRLTCRPDRTARTRTAGGSPSCGTATRK